MASERKGFSFTWQIKNFSFWSICTVLYSPVFILQEEGTLKCTKWKISLYSSLGDINLFLNRGKHGVAQNRAFYFNYEFAFIGSDGLPVILEERLKQQIGVDCCSPGLSVRCDDVFVKRKDYFLPPDTLTVRCRLWTDDVSWAAQCNARTRIDVEHINFVGVVEDFAHLTVSKVKEFVINSASENKPNFTLALHLSGDGVINVKMTFDKYEAMEVYTCEIFILDSRGKGVRCGKDELLRGVGPIVRQFPLTLTTKHLLDNKALYLPKDSLSLRCEIAFSDGNTTEEIKETEYNYQSTFLVPDPLVCLDIEEPSMGSLLSLKNDLLSLHRDAILCDTKLRTPTETFSAHKNILSARSPVFRAMFSNDMKEKFNDCVDIADLDADTVRRMLLFLYTATLEELQWENAKKLYFAADKYEIPSLKIKCSSFLKEHLDSSNCCDVLRLADMHHDCNLKEAAQKYIAKHDREVFRSIQWRSIEKDCPQLGFETMRFTYVKDPEK